MDNKPDWSDAVIIVSIVVIVSVLVVLWETGAGVDLAYHLLLEK